MFLVNVFLNFRAICRFKSKILFNNDNLSVLLFSAAIHAKLISITHFNRVSPEVVALFFHHFLVVNRNRFAGRRYSPVSERIIELNHRTSLC